MTDEIFIKALAWRKMFAYATLASPNEIIGWLLTEEQSNGTIVITDVILLKQNVSGGTCEMVIDKTVTDIEHPENIRGFWHSHVNMGSFHSSTDDDTLYGFGDPEAGSRYAISIVISLPSEAKAWIQFFQPVETPKIEVPLSLIFGDEDTLYAECAKEVKEKVSKKEWSTKGFRQSKGYAYAGYTEEELGSYEHPGTKFGLTQQEIDAINTKDSSACPHLQYGKKGPYCFIKGKKYNCESCRRNPDDSARHCDVKNGTTCAKHGNDCMKCPENPDNVPHPLELEPSTAIEKIMADTSGG